jgi:hypothetical protein
LDAELVQGCQLIRAPLQKPAFQGVRDRVADHVNRARCQALAAQDVALDVGGGEKQVRHVVDHDPVVLLGHAPVVGSKPGLDVDDGNLQSVGCEGTRQGGRGVPLHDHEIRTNPGQHRLHARDHPRQLLARRSDPDPEMHIRFGEMQLAEQRRTAVRVVLAGMDDGHLQAPR